MNNRHENYPNKADFEPNIDKNLKDGETEELPLADPSESNATQSFRESESKQGGKEQQSAFGVNKDNKANR